MAPDGSTGFSTARKDNATGGQMPQWISSSISTSCRCSSNVLASKRTRSHVNWGCASCKAFPITRSEEHTSELQSLMRISYAVFCLKKKNKTNTKHKHLV